MNEKAICYIIFFAVMIIVNRWFNKWILLKVYESANLTWKDVLEYRATLRGSTKQPRLLTNWLLRVSPNPKKTRKLLNLYNLVILPSVICLSFSVMGLFTHLFDTFLDYACFIVLGITMITTIFGTVNGFRK